MFKKVKLKITNIFLIKTEIAGRNNPLFICKEVLIKPPSSSESENELESEEVEFITRKPDTKNKIGGRLQDDPGTRIEVSEEATDAFVVYTAISSGSTTVLLLIVVAIFCCCRCNKRQKEHHREYHQNILYNRAPAGESPYHYWNVQKLFKLKQIKKPHLPLLWFIAWVICLGKSMTDEKICSQDWMARWPIGVGGQQ